MREFHICSPNFKYTLPYCTFEHIILRTTNLCPLTNISLFLPQLNPVVVKIWQACHGGLLVITESTERFAIPACIYAHTHIDYIHNVCLFLSKVTHAADLLCLNIKCFTYCPALLAYIINK